MMPERTENDELDEMTTKVLKFICDESDIGDLSAGQVARHFNMEISNLSHRFKAATSYTLSDYINARKLVIACQKLQETDESINSIAESLGYLHTSSFTRMFKKVYGVSPTQYREQSARKCGKI